MDALNHRIAFLPILALTAIGFGDMPYKPNAYQQNDWFAEFGENLGSYVNPASIAEADQIEVGAGVYRTLSGKAGQEFVSAVHPFGYNHTVALTYFENGSDIEGSNASYLENAYILGYALRMPWGAPGGISHQLRIHNGRGVDAHLVRTRIQQAPHIINLAHATAYGERNKHLRCHRLDDVQDDIARIAGSGDV